MDRKLINPLIVTGIADAVRAKGKTTEPIKVADLPEAIMNLPEGGGVGEDTSALLDAIGVESREDTGMANGLAIALTDSATEQMWSGERSVADGAPIKDGVAFVSTLKGKTMKVNQMVKYGNFATSSGWIAEVFRTFSVVDGKAVIEVTDTNTSNNGILSSGANAFSLNKGHIYLLACGFELQSTATSTAVSLKLASLASLTNVTSNQKSGSLVSIFVSDNDYTNKVINISTQRVVEGDVLKVWNVMLFDLTEMGMENVTSGDDFAQRYGKKSIAELPYIPPQDTNLQSFAPNAIVSKGRNLLRLTDENKFNYQSYYDKYEYTNTGIRCDAPALSLWKIPCKPNTKYTATISPSVLGKFQFRAYQYYDEPSLFANNDSSLISTIFNDSQRYQITFTTASNATWLEIGGYAPEAIDLSNFMIEQGDTIHAYTPYREPSRLDFDLTTIKDAQGNQLFPDGELRSAGSVADMVDYANNVAVKGKKVIGKYTFTGNETMAKATNEIRITMPSIFAPKLPSSNQVMANIMMAEYERKTAGNVYSAVEGVALTVGRQIWIYDSSRSEVASLREYLSGKTIYYELAEPIEGEAPLVKSFYPVQNNGSEEAITDNIVPMNADIRYRVDTESLLTQSTALLAYSNEVTGANNTSLGDAVKTLTDSYK